MTLLNPAAFYILFASLLILVLHFLRSRERQREVSALFLWEGLPGDPQSRAAQIRQQVDPLLLLQLAIFLVLVTALAQPAWRMRTASLSGLAIVLDGSASMRTATEDGSTRYEHAMDEARSLLDQYPSTTAAVIQLSSRPTILARPGLEHVDLQDAILRSEPTWYGDGTAVSLLSLLGSIGGTSRFERVVVLSDHSFSDMPDSFQTILIDGGDNLALTGFSVRENPEGEGVTALVTALNDTDAYQDVKIRIDDRENQTTLSLLMAPQRGSSFRFRIRGARCSPRLSNRKTVSLRTTGASSRSIGRSTYAFVGSAARTATSWRHSDPSPLSPSSTPPRTRTSPSSTEHARRPPKPAKSSLSTRESRAFWLKGRLFPRLGSKS